MTSASFDLANRLWFREGRTGKALAAYQQALREAPDDPVVAFQLARVLSSFDRFAEARSALARAHANRDKLNDTAQHLLDDWRVDLEGRPPERYFPELPPALLDRDRLESGELPAGGWRTVADAAASREMYGLAWYALERSQHVPIDADDAKDFDRIQTTLYADEHVLREMYAAKSRGNS